MRHVAAGSCGEEHAVAVFELWKDIILPLSVRPASSYGDDLLVETIMYARLASKTYHYEEPSIQLLALQDVGSSHPSLGRKLLGYLFNTLGIFCPPGTIRVNIPTGSTRSRTASRRRTFS